MNTVRVTGTTDPVEIAAALVALRRVVTGSCADDAPIQWRRLRRLALVHTSRRALVTAQKELRS